MKGRMISCTVQGSRVYATLELPLGAADEMLRLSGEDIDTEISKHKERRSLNSNRYMWELISRIAESLTPPLDKDECYKMMLQRYGQSFMIEVKLDAIPSLFRAYKYIDYLESDGFTASVRVYVGSSEYNTKEMSSLVDGIIGEAKVLGIDVDLPQLSRLLKEG